MLIELSFPSEFGAGFSIDYSKLQGLKYSKGTIGGFNIKDYPKQRDITLLMSKLLENNDKLYEQLSLLQPKFIQTERSLEDDRRKIESLYPNLLKVYFDSDMFKKRVNKK